MVHVNTRNTEKNTHPHTNARSLLATLPLPQGVVGVSWLHSQPHPLTALGCVLTCGVGSLGLLLTVRAAVEEVGGHLSLTLDLHQTTALQLVAPTDQHIIQVCGDLWTRRKLSPTFVKKHLNLHNHAFQFLCQQMHLHLSTHDRVLLFWYSVWYGLV